MTRSSYSLQTAFITNLHQRINKKMIKFIPKSSLNREKCGGKIGHYFCKNKKELIIFLIEMNFQKNVTKKLKRGHERVCVF